MIRVSASYEAPKGTVTIKKSFMLNIEPADVDTGFSEPEEVLGVKARDYIVLEEWEGGVKLVERAKPKGDEPIPYIESFSSTGMMKIGWSDKMNPPKDLALIPPALVAIQVN